MDFLSENFMFEKVSYDNRGKIEHPLQTRNPRSSDIFPCTQISFPSFISAIIFCIIIELVNSFT